MCWGRATLLLARADMECTGEGPVPGDGVRSTAGSANGRCRWLVAAGTSRSAVTVLVARLREAGAGAGIRRASGEHWSFPTARSCSQSISGCAGATASKEAVV